MHVDARLEAQVRDRHRRGPQRERLRGDRAERVVAAAADGRVAARAVAAGAAAAADVPLDVLPRLLRPLPAAHQHEPLHLAREEVDAAEVLDAAVPRRAVDAAAAPRAVVGGRAQPVVVLPRRAVVGRVCVGRVVQPVVVVQQQREQVGRVADAHDDDRAVLRRAQRLEVDVERVGRLGGVADLCGELLDQRIDVHAAAVLGPRRAGRVGLGADDAAVGADRHVARVELVDARDGADALGVRRAVDHREQRRLARVGQRVRHAERAHVVDVDGHVRVD